MGRCFVAMPYGTTEQEKKEFSRVYKFLIKAAAEEAGLECIRSDIEGRGGHILSNVIDDLVNADIVIADISDLNWNVAYELGMRHVLQKNGTILICNEKTELPFDIQSLNVFIYPSDWLDDMEELSEGLKKSIQGRLNGATKSDSPVHDKYPNLPHNVVLDYDSNVGENLKAAQEQILQLENKLSNINEKSGALESPNSESKDDSNGYFGVFLSALESSKYGGSKAIAKLQEMLDKNDDEGFLRALGKTLDIGAISEADCRTIYALCQKFGQSSITITYLEAVVKFFPESDELKGHLADEYSRNHNTSEKALQLVNKIIGVSKIDGDYVLSRTTKVTLGKLGNFFNIYLRLEKYNDIIEIGYLLHERFSENNKICSMVYRNMTDACIRMNALDKAGEFIEKAVQYGPSNDLSYWMRAKYENELGNYTKSIENIEKCIKLDSSDIDYYFIMSAYICDDLYARNPETMQIEKIDSKNAAQYVLPFILTALTLDRSCANRAIDFLRRNKFVEYIQPIVDAFQEGVTNFQAHFKDLDYSAVAYCLADSDK